MKQPIEEIFNRKRYVNPGLMLMNSPYFVFIMSFLYRAFRDPDNNEAEKVRTADSLERELSRYLTIYNARDNPKTYRKMKKLVGKVPDLSAKQLLAQWCNDNHKWLLHNVDHGDTYELTSYTNQVFEYTENEENAFNSYKTQDIWKNIINKTAELASGMTADTDARIKYHERRIKELTQEIQDHQDAINEIREKGEVIPFSREEIVQMQEYIHQLLTQFRFEIGKYKEKVVSLTDDFHNELADINENHKDDGKVIANLLDKMGAFKKDTAYLCIDHLIELTGSSEVSNRLMEENDIISRGLRKQNISRQTNVIKEVGEATVEINKINANYNSVSQRIKDILLELDNEERRYVDSLLRKVDLLGRTLRNARRKDPFTTELLLGGAKCMRSDFTIAGKELEFRDTIKKTQHRMGKVKVASSTKMVSRKKKGIDWDRIRANVEEAIEKYGYVTLGRLAKDYPFTQAIDEVAAYTKVLSEYSFRINPKHLEEVRAKRIVKRKDGSEKIVRSIRVITTVIQAGGKKK